MSLPYGILGLIVYLAVCQCHPLEDYVKRDDGVYGYEEISRFTNENYTLVNLNVTTHRWMTEEFSNHAIWWSTVTILFPTTITITDMTFIFVGIGNNIDWEPETPDGLFAPLLWQMASDTGSVTAMISQVPNQPIILTADPESEARYEDDLIGLTWDYFMSSEEPRDPEVLLQFPMTKTLTRSMDAIMEFTQEENSELNIDKFILGGPSKRGQAPWLAGSVDDRIVGLVPMNIGILNLIPNFHHHYRSLGGWSWAIEPYWNHNIFERIDSPEAQELAEMIDPYEFIDNYTMPKLIMTASLDEFFCVDANQFFFDELPGIKYNWVIDNTNHYLVPSWGRVATVVSGFFMTVHEDGEWPEFTYEIVSGEDDGEVTVTVTSGEPTSVTGWFANTESTVRRDFRFLRRAENGTDLEINDVLWDEDDVENLGEGRYRLHYDAPEEGWLGFFITMEFEAPGGTTIELSSEVNVIPNTFSFEQCEGEACRGVIV